MTPLRRRMQEELQRRNYSDITAVCYLRHVAEFARHFGRSPDLLGAEEIKQFQLHLIQKRKVSWATYIQAMAALRFLYVKTLGLTFMAGKIPYPRRPKLLPTVLSQEEVSRLLDGTRSLKHRVLLMTLYGGGLRVSEACRLTLADIDSSRKPRDAKIGMSCFHVKRDNRRFAHPWNGYVAIIAGSTRDVHKYESTVVERLILDVAEITDRKPQVNVHPGHISRVLRFCRDEMLRIAVAGYDPLIPPAEAKPLPKVKEIKVTAFADSDDEYDFTHDWSLRRIRRPII